MRAEPRAIDILLQLFRKKRQKATESDLQPGVRGARIPS